MSEIIETRGDFRVRLEQDPDITEAPDHDGQGYVVEVTYSGHSEVRNTGDYGDHGPDFELGWLLARTRNDYELVERYLRIFHGAASFDHTHWDRDSEMFFIVTETQALAWGVATEDWHRLAGWTRETWEQHRDGDVYGYVVEERQVWTNARGDEMETWEHVDSCWGFYGYEYAEQEARAALAAHTEEETA